MPKQNCPLCNTPAGFESIDLGRKKKFDCPKCTYFVISSATEKKIQDLTEKQKEDLSTEPAKCKNENILIIYSDNNGNIITDCKSESVLS